MRVQVVAERDVTHLEIRPVFARDVGAGVEIPDEQARWVLDAMTQWVEVQAYLRRIRAEQDLARRGA